ncbi:MAG: bifunctional DNA primase/polymerase [Planctomycetes bacterium]|nr:bifunctional DNA primase/polymerase [Planctomycetota bacterium]
MSADLSELTAMAAGGCRFVRLARCEKRPVGAAWQTKSTDDIDTVAGWLRSRSNVGLLLGPASGVVDVEFDTPDGLEQLAAFGVLDIRTPTWRSARGEHRLFRWEPWMPTAAMLKVDSLEVRIGSKAAQSVLPPSRHPDGSEYRWIVPPSAASVAGFPAQLLAGVPCGA